jgi:SAM-dependent methyltransferase
MKRTDYSSTGSVAARYDENLDRLRIAPDAVLAELLEREPGRPRAVLDLACGTGNWLRVQMAAFAGRGVSWAGLDASETMLERARAKLEGADLRLGRAESLPWPDGAFDLVITSFAFHHFEDKPRTLDEMVRVLAPGGALEMANISPRHMPAWWVYRRFEGALADDEERFWSSGKIFEALDERGLEPVVRVEIELARLPLHRIAEDIERRDISQLAIASDADWSRALARVRADLAADPDGREASEVALLRCVAWRRPA